MNSRKDSTVTTTKEGVGWGLTWVAEEGVVGLWESALIPVHSAGLRPDVP